jgi:hypothetical protein
MCCLIACVTQVAAAQDDPPTLGDLARQERERRAASHSADEPQPGTPAPLALPGELIPAHFLRFEGEVLQTEYSVTLNGKAVLRNTRVRSLPLYVSPYLLEGTNQLEVGFTSDPEKPLDIVIEERFAGEAEHRAIAHFHANANEFPEQTRKQLTFIAHPKAVPAIQLSDADRIAIHKLVREFYDAAADGDSVAVMELFEPAIEDAGAVYPEGAEFGKQEMTHFAHLISQPDCAMEPYNPAGLTFVANGNVVTVKRRDGTPVFISGEVPGDPEEAAASRVSADVIPVKKINDVWRLTLPFGF